MEIAIIMGAGPAGLTAAYELLTKTNIKPIVIEADNQVGGLSKTINYKGNLIDIGGHRFFSKSQKIIDWWLQFLPLENLQIGGNIPITYRHQSTEIRASSFAQNTDKASMLVRPRKSRIYYRHHFFDYPLRPSIKTLRNLGLAKTFRIAISYMKGRTFPEKPEKNLAQFFRNRFGKELYDTFFKDYTEKVWGVSCEEIPSDWGKQRIKDLNIWKAVFHYFTSAFFSNKTLAQKGISTSLIEQFLYPQKGPGQMWEAVANKIVELGGEIHLSANVENVIVGENNVVESIRWQNAKTGLTKIETANYFFSSIPIKELVNGMQGIKIEENILSLANGLDYRDFLIVGLSLKKSQAQNESNLSMLTDNWIYLQDKGIRAGRVQIFNNWSPFMVEDKDTVSIGVEYFCNETDEFWNAQDEKIIQQAIHEMQTVGLVRGEDVKDAKVIKVKKAYPSYTGSYASFPALQSFLDSFENLFLIGRNGMHRYNNSDHSMMTAMLAVENIMTNRKDKSNIWEVNMEEDYLEES